MWVKTALPATFPGVNFHWATDSTADFPNSGVVARTA